MEKLAKVDNIEDLKEYFKELLENLANDSINIKIGSLKTIIELYELISREIKGLNMNIREWTREIWKDTQNNGAGIVIWTEGKYKISKDVEKGVKYKIHIMYESIMKMEKYIYPTGSDFIIRENQREILDIIEEFGHNICLKIGHLMNNKRKELILCKNPSEKCLHSHIVYNRAICTNDQYDNEETIGLVEL